MKNKTKFLGFIAVMAIVFSMAACGDNDDNNDNNNNNNNNNGETGPREVLDTIHSYNANGELTSYIEHEYDSKGNMTKHSSYSANGELRNYIEYEYDSKGNQTKWSQYNVNGDLAVCYNCRLYTNERETYHRNTGKHGGSALAGTAGRTEQGVVV